jgi:ABC-type transport system substrate-binding protein
MPRDLTVRSTRRPWRLVVALLAGTSLLAASCGGDDAGDDASGETTPTEVEEAPQMGGTLVYALDSESDGYNPLSKRFAQAGHTVASSVFDTLATWNKDGEVVPYLAESLEPNDDFTVWTITLREGVVFHSGKALTGEIVAEILNAHRDSLVTSSNWADVDRVEATGDLEVTVTTSLPWVNFPTMLTTQAGYIFDPDMLTDPDSGSRPVGTGPFMFESWEVGDTFTVVRNPDYWRTDEFGNQLPYLDEIQFKIIPDAQARNDALDNGDVDLLYTLTPSAVLDLRERSGFNLSEYNLGDEDLVSFQTDATPRPTGPNGEERVSPFNNVHARRAIAYATDQAAFLTDVQQDVNVEATSPWSPGQLGYREDNGYPGYDPEKAREELAAYTADTGQETLTFTYLSADDVDNVRAAQYMVDMWAEVGIVAELKAVPQVDIITNAVIGTYEALDWRNWGAPDPDTDMLWFHSDSVRPLEEGISVNIAHWTTPEIDAALERGRSSTDEAERDEAYAEVAAHFAEDVPYLFLGRVGWAMAATPDIHGWQVATQNGTVATIGVKTYLADIWID